MIVRACEAEKLWRLDCGGAHWLEENCGELARQLGSLDGELAGLCGSLDGGLGGRGGGGN